MTVLSLAGSLKQLDGLAERPGHIPAHMPYPQQFNRPVLAIPCHQRPIQPRIIRPQPLYALARNVGFFPYAQPLPTDPVMYSSNNLNYAYIHPASLPQMPLNRFIPHANNHQLSASIQCRYNEAQCADQNGLRASLFTRHSALSVPASTGSPASSPVSDDAADRNGNGPPSSGSAGNEKRQPITRPMNSFMLYSKVHRHKVHSLYPHLDNRTVSKLLGETWYQLEQTCKMKYAILAADMKKEHTLQPPIELTSPAHSEMPDSPASGTTESIIVVEDDDDKDVDSNGVVDSEPLDLKMPAGGAQRTVPEQRPSRNEEAYAQRGAKCRRPWASTPSIFHLDPTPVQVKRAQMTGRTPLEASNSSVAAVTSAMAEQSFTQRMLSKFECEIEKLPQFDFSNYQLPDWAKKSLRPSSPRIEPYNKRNKSDDSHNKKRRRFFGDDFDQAGA